MSWLVTSVGTDCDKMNIPMSPNFCDVVIIPKHVHVKRKFYENKVWKLKRAENQC